MAGHDEVLTIPVAGMTCDHCVETVRRALESVPGVRSATVDLGAARAEITLDPSQTDRAGIATAIAAAGYTVPSAVLPPTPKLVSIGLPLGIRALPDKESAASPVTEEWNLAIGGMHCASCVARVEGALERVPGVKEARVNLATERASVIVDPATVKEAALSQAAADAGYSARRQEFDPAAGSDVLRNERARAVAVWRNRLIAGVVLTTPLVVLGYVPNGLLGLTTPVGWIMLPFAAVLQVYLGGPYLVGAWNRLKQGSSNMDTLIALGTSTAFGYSLYQLVGGEPHHAHFFMDAACFVFFLCVTLGPIVVDEASRYLRTKNTLP